MFLHWLADVLRQAGLTVVEFEGWATRAKSSGSYAEGRPWGVMWHHSASSPSVDPADLAAYCALHADAAPICNVNVERDGTVWVLAAGPTNTNGKGRAYGWTRGVVPADSMNSYAFGMELSNAGTGEPYPQVQIDAAFVVSNTVNARCGNRPGDVGTHEDYAPDRKIDPATAAAVQGPWRPDAITTAGSWSVINLAAECERRAQIPGDEMACTLYELIDADAVFVGMSADGVGTDVSWCDAHRAERYRAIPSVVRRPTTIAELESMILLGPLPANDTRHSWTGAEFIWTIA